MYVSLNCNEIDLAGRYTCTLSHCRCRSNPRGIFTVNLFILFISRVFVCVHLLRLDFHTLNDASHSMLNIKANTRAQQVDVFGWIKKREENWIIITSTSIKNCQRSNNATITARQSEELERKERRNAFENNETIASIAWYTLSFFSFYYGLCASGCFNKNSCCCCFSSFWLARTISAMRYFIQYSIHLWTLNRKVNPIAAKNENRNNNEAINIMFFHSVPSYVYNIHGFSLCRSNRTRQIKPKYSGWVSSNRENLHNFLFPARFIFMVSWTDKYSIPLYPMEIPPTMCVHC